MRKLVNIAACSIYSPLYELKLFVTRRSFRNDPVSSSGLNYGSAYYITSYYSPIWNQIPGQLDKVMGQALVGNRGILVNSDIWNLWLVKDKWEKRQTLILQFSLHAVISRYFRTPARPIKSFTPTPSRHGDKGGAGSVLVGHKSQRVKVSFSKLLLIHHYCL